MICLIVAASNNRVIGKDNTLPWNIPEDLEFFKHVTGGSPIIMGRKTWESLPKKPLPNRVNLVLTTDTTFKAEGATVVHSANEAILTAKSCYNYNFTKKVFIIGGEQIYNLFFDRADAIYYTKVPIECEGDAYFPTLNNEWALCQTLDIGVCSFNVYVRVPELLIDGGGAYFVLNGVRRLIYGVDYMFMSSIMTSNYSVIYMKQTSTCYNGVCIPASIIDKYKTT